MEINDIIDLLSKEIDSRRLEHSINVMKVSEQMAGIMGAINKARIAAILHDCGKL